MSKDAPPLSQPAQPVAAPGSPPDDDLGIDRAFLISMAQIPFMAAGFAALAVVVAFTLSRLQVTPQLGMMALLSLGMILAAFIDAWLFKVPNWLTLSMVLAGWIIGLLYNFGLPLDPGLVGEKGPVVGIGTALFTTFLGFVLLAPMLLIGGMGQGDVKMQMAFGSWVGVTFAAKNTVSADRVFLGIFGGNDMVSILVGGYILGVMFGGLMGLVMMVMRRQFQENASNLGEIVTDLRVLVSAGPAVAAARAGERRPRWARLPYGVPLCLGYLAYLGWLLYEGNLPYPPAPTP